MTKLKNHRKSTTTTTTKDVNQNQSQQPQKRQKQPSWTVIRGLLLTCRNVQVQQQQKQAQPDQGKRSVPEENSKKCKKMKCSGLLCNNTKVMDDVHKKKVSMSGACNNNDASNFSISMKAPQNEINGIVSSNSSVSGSFSGMPFRKLSGCYECQMVVDPFTRDSSLRGTIWSCPDCDEIFMKAESLEHHQAVKHAVSELGPEDTSKNIVEIIFHSSWLKKQSPECKIDRILKVHNTQKTICKFEEYRDSIKAKATNHSKKHPRCIADGNELLRFHCTTFVCSLGLNGSSNLCNSITQCKVCNIIKNGFKVTEEESNGAKGILTSATSGKAHDKVDGVSDDYSNDKRAMLVCRVIAGRVKKNGEGGILEEYDSVAEGIVGAYSNMDELYVFNHRAILPCFVVIYRAF